MFGEGSAEPLLSRLTTHQSHDSRMPERRVPIVGRFEQGYERLNGLLATEFSQALGRKVPDAQDFRHSTAR